MSFVERCSIEAGRSVVNSVLKFPLPYEFRDQQESIKKAEQFLKAGYGLIGFTTHFSYGDFMRVAGAVMTRSGEIRKRKILIPLALHQSQKPGLMELCWLTKVDTSLITTPDTKKKEKSLKDLKKPVPWEEHIEGFGTKEYLERAASLLQEGGIVLCAPQTGRRATLEPFEKRTVSALDVSVRRRKVEKVAVCFMGLGVPDLNDYSPEKSGGFNFFKKYVITFGNVSSIQELRAKAKETGKSIDEAAHDIMLGLVPKAYQPA